MTAPNTAWAEEDEEELRPFAMTRGRTRPTHPVDISSYVKLRAQAGDAGALDEEQQLIVAECHSRRVPVAVVELAGRTTLPLQVVKIVVSDLIDTGFMIMAMPATDDQPSVALLERVIERLKQTA